jgi:phosphoglycolate phosphatase-like HAD superfamily hydrolase
VAAVRPAGKTDRQILREVLAAAGLPADPSHDDVLSWERSACAAYERLERDELPRDEPVAAMLARLRDRSHALALLTGNLEPIARRKLGLRGLVEFFPPGQGGFGSDANLRPELVPIARERAGGHARDQTLVIGDTPYDVAAASADGVRAIAITGRLFGAADLRDAGAWAVIDELTEVEELVGRA